MLYHLEGKNNKEFGAFFEVLKTSVRCFSIKNNDL